MKLLITGAKGFIGSNLVSQLHSLNDIRSNKNEPPFILYEYDTKDELSLLDTYTKDCDFVLHLAGVNRSNNIQDFDNNFDFTSSLTSLLKKNCNQCPILYASSIHAENNTPYGVSKQKAEKIIFNYGKETHTKTYIYRLTNVFGKWCKPNYNSVIATFCNNIANNLSIEVDDPNKVLKLVYVDDVIDSFISKLYINDSLEEDQQEYEFETIEPIYSVTIKEIVDLLYSYRDGRTNFYLPQLNTAFEKALYSTYFSYIPQDSLAYSLKMHKNDIGSFTEFARTNSQGQFSVNIIKPSMTKGNHWHRTKLEKFMVVNGEALISLRKIGSNAIIQYDVNGSLHKIVDIPPGYTHSITNIGEIDLVVLIWCNECFNQQNPDTYFEKVHYE